MDGADETVLTERQRYWLEQIQACKAQGSSVAAYASAHGLEVRTMYGAKKVLVRKGVLPRTHHARFQRVQTPAARIDGDWRIRLPNGVSVDFSGSVDAVNLSTVLNTAASLG